MTEQIIKYCRCIGDLPDDWPANAPIVDCPTKDSLAPVEIIMGVEDKYGVIIGDDEIDMQVTLGDISRLVLAKLKAVEV